MKKIIYLVLALFFCLESAHADCIPLYENWLNARENEVSKSEMARNYGSASSVISSFGAGFVMMTKEENGSESMTYEKVAALSIALPLVIATVGGVNHLFQTKKKKNIEKAFWVVEEAMLGDGPELQKLYYEMQKVNHRVHYGNMVDQIVKWNNNKSLCLGLDLWTYKQIKKELTSLIP